jgi:Domain of unknown function (DUF202)
MTVDDHGATPERTSIAWERTALAVVVGAALVARLNAERLTALGILPLIATTLAALGAMAGRAPSGLLRCQRGPSTDGFRPLLLAGAVFGLGASDIITTYSG